MACRSSGSLIPAPWTSAARCRSWSGCCRGIRGRVAWLSFRTRARDTFHWKVFRAEADRVVIVRPPCRGSRPVTDVIVTTERPGLARWRWAVTAAFGLGGIAITAWGPRLPAIKASLGTGTATIGLLLAGVTVGAILGLLASTPVLHRLGSRRSIAGALLLIAAAIAVMGLALVLSSVPLVATAFVIVGLGIGILDVLINVEGSAVEQAAKRTLMPM